MATGLPPVPDTFKPIQHYLKTAVEHDKRDPVVAYYCRLYGLQKGMEIDRKSPDCRNYLASLMNTLEEAKRQHQDLEAVQNEIVGQAHLENYALKLFLYADNEDRAGRFGKNVVKSFYTAGMLMDVLTNFGEISEDIEKNRKYAKWKAAYIHNCLKNGETPISGPLPEDGEMDDSGAAGGAAESGAGFMPVEPGYPPQQPSSAFPLQPPTAMDPRGVSPVGGYQPNQPNYSQPSFPGVGQPPGGTMPSNVPVAAPRGAPPAAPVAQPQATYPQPAAGGGGGVQLKTEDYNRAMKLCKFASSALQYEDPKTAVENLTKALNLLTTGHE